MLQTAVFIADSVSIANRRRFELQTPALQVGTLTHYTTTPSVFLCTLFFCVYDFESCENLLGSS